MNFQRAWGIGFLFGLFVFLFLFVFQPFGLDEATKIGVFPFVGYGLVTFVGYVFANGFVPLLSRNFFRTEQWNLAKEMGMVAFNFSLICLLNVFYTHCFFGLEITWKAYFTFFFYTFSIGVFPITIVVFTRERSLRSKFESTSRDINEHIQPFQIQTDDTVELQVGNEIYLFKVDQFLYAKSDGNYVELFLIDGKSERLKKELIRFVMKNLEAHLETFPQVIRCHKSYLVNLNHVRKISGNAQGLKLHLPFEEQIPVSRQMNDFIKSSLTNRP